MAGARYCSTCKMTHEGTTGKKCSLSTQNDGVTDTTESLPVNQDQQISPDQALATASQVVVRDDPQGTSHLLKNQPSSQDPILAELLKISQRFGHLEEQAAKDRQVLTGLVSEFGKHGQAVQQLISQTQHTSHVCPVEQNLSLISANHNVMDLPHSAAADRDTINGRNNSAGNHIIHNKQHHNTSNHTNSVGSLFSTSTQSVNPANIGVNSQSGTQRDANMQCSINSASQHDTMLLPHTRSANNSAHATTHMQQTQQSGGGKHVSGGVQSNVSNSVYSTPQVTGTTQNYQGASTSQVISNNATHHTDGQQGASQASTTQQCVILSMQALRNAAETHQRVNQRYQELEQATNFKEAGNLELLFDTLQKRFQKQEKLKVKWPQDLAFIGTHRRRPSYEQLTAMQWLLAFLRIREEEKDPLIKEHMIQYLTELTQDACDFFWEATKGAHSVLLHRMADGVVDWTNIAEIQKIRQRYAQTNSVQHVQERQKINKTAPCIQFNKGQCSRPGDHEWKNLLLRHICQYCYTTFQKTESHSKKDCWKAAREQPKN